MAAIGPIGTAMVMWLEIISGPQVGRGSPCRRVLMSAPNQGTKLMIIAALRAENKSVPNDLSPPWLGDLSCCPPELQLFGRRPRVRLRFAMTSNFSP